VRFTRMPLLRMHQALGCVLTAERVLFPEARHFAAATVPTAADLQRIRPGNRNIETNEPQLRAVASILNLPPESPPFIVFGP